MANTETTVLSALIRAADGGEPCPSNTQLVELTGVCGTCSIHRAILQLERKGLIRVERGSRTRVVAILASGKRTAPTLIERRSAHRPRKPDFERLNLPIPAPVHRDPCARCGARGDVDCGHRAVARLIA